MKWSWLNAFFVAFSVLVIVFIILFVTLMNASNKLTTGRESFETCGGSCERDTDCSQNMTCKNKRCCQ